ncbi:arsenate reductase (glutaredoxin) [Thalassotalea maritima]|uniref:arsenate reductase (glutaredoxin) n=1 Tax=Thalassotalea maritima TaxID=3242416 RepID=UPI003527F4EE
MSKLTIFHNPRCSKSRQTLQLIQDAGKEVDIVEYLKTPPTATTLTNILALLNVDVRQMMRVKESEYKEQGLSAPELTTEQLIEAMVATPKLIERPIVLSANKDKAIIGRPPENVEQLF